MKKIFLYLTTCIFLLVICGTYFLHYRKNNKVVPITNGVTAGKDTSQETDTFAYLQSANSDFVAGREALTGGDYVTAVKLFKKSKEGVTSYRQLATIDFNIAEATFGVDKSQGIDAYMVLSKNESYNKRTRALAMLRAYINALKFNDASLFLQVYEAYGVESLTSNKSDLNGRALPYMQKVYAVYPFAYPALIMLRSELSKTTDPQTALNLYYQYSKNIGNNLEDLSTHSGEKTEYVISLLQKSYILGLLAANFKVVSVDDVKKSYQTLIDYDQSKGIVGNQQYALLGYADFLSKIKDYPSAEKVMNILLSEKLDKTLGEIPPANDIRLKYLALPDLAKNTKNKDIIKFINTIVATINK
jgi:hypothetical protein